MKKPKRKTKSKEDLTEDQVKDLCEKAGFVFVCDHKNKKTFGKPESQLNQTTIIFPEGSSKGYTVK